LNLGMELWRRRMMMMEVKIGWRGSQGIDNNIRSNNI
jgi:hypothetical protein